jgi:signal transduction histidine kinase/HAMP domain-containing protein
MASGSRRRGRGLTYRRQVILVLVLVAVVPLAIFGVAAIRSVEDVVSDEAVTQARTAIGGVAAVLARDASDLAETTESYATWQILQDEVASLDLEAIRRDVIQFQIDRGDLDVIVLAVGDRGASGGSGSAAAVLSSLADAALGRSSLPASGSAGPIYADLGDGVYLVDIRPIDLGDRTGPGVAAGIGKPVGLAFARRLDPSFIVDAREVTGFDGAVFDRSGRLRVASDEAAADAFAPTLDPAASPGQSVALRSGLAGGSMTLLDAEGHAVGWYVATIRIEGLRTVGSRLVPLLAIGLVLAVLAATILAILLGRRLRLRLDAIGGGLSAMAAGDLAIRLPADDRDEIGRLASALDRMGDTLERRDRILRATIREIAGLTPDLGVGRVHARGLAAAGRIFELSEMTLEDADGIVLVQATEPPEAPGGQRPEASGPSPAPAGAIARGRLVSAALGPVTDDGAVAPGGPRLAGRLPVGQDWSEADQSLLDVYARLLRAAIDDAAVHARTLDRVDRLGRLTRLQGDFLRGVSHNLQAPLTSIAVVADELATADTTDAHAREGVEIIRAQADRLARLVSQLLTLSRLEAGTLLVEAEPVVPTPIVRRVWSSLGVDRPFQLDDRAQGMVAFADRAALEQVAWMLLDNAVKYAPTGPIEVVIEPADADERIAVTVFDHGPGIPPDERARVFRRFERGSTSRGLDGTGLGLDVARGLVRAMGGSIRYVPAPGGGAGFRFTVPAERSEQPA